VAQSQPVLLGLEQFVVVIEFIEFLVQLIVERGGLISVKRSVAC